ncbi:efflux RND transporter periplasmic adaptor subunit [Candidatus Clostridium stratigraminis]|uniref:Efflux RND transporter periplasmic adaptor subunit n=1 Tax=Candidatus Clostridium stratigraminis TaxID=3381661 RepID=A0ABW8T633_9CLOT
MINKIRKTLILGICLVISVGFAGCSSAKKEDKSIPVLVSPVAENLKTEKVRKGSIEKVGQTNGTIVPAIKTDLCFKFKGGYLSKLNVKAGDLIKKGDIIAELDTTDLQYSIKLEALSVKAAQLTYDNAVKNNYPDIEQQKASLALQAENLKMEQLNNELKDSVLRAGAAGKVIFVADVKISQFISGFQTIATVADMNSIQVQSDGSLKDYAVGIKAVIEGNEKDYKGEIVSNTTANEGTTQNTKIVVKFLESAKGLNVGDVVTITCTFLKKEGVIVVPYKAVRFAVGDHPYVRISNDGDIIEKYVETGIQDGDNIEITSGLSEGDTIVLN